jgi:hypothetical protein
MRKKVEVWQRSEFDGRNRQINLACALAGKYPHNTAPNGESGKGLAAKGLAAERLTPPADFCIVCRSHTEMLSAQRVSVDFGVEEKGVNYNHLPV